PRPSMSPWLSMVTSPSTSTPSPSLLPPAVPVILPELPIDVVVSLAVSRLMPEPRCPVDAGTGIVVDHQRQFSGDPMTHAADRAAIEIMHAAEADILEIDAVAVTGSGGSDLTAVVDGCIGARPNGVRIRGRDHPPRSRW